jgi:hypothetical protein
MVLWLQIEFTYQRIAEFGKRIFVAVKLKSLKYNTIIVILMQY